MKNKGLTLLKTLLLSTSSINIIRTTKDKKKRGRLIGSLIGMGVLYIMLIAYGIASSFGYAYYGLAYKMPEMTALIISAISFIFTLFKAGSYLFGFREYEMLMALPFKEKDIVGSKFLYMYVKTLPWIIVISVSMLVGYGIFVTPSWYVYLIWIVLSVTLPIIPMLAASFVAFLIARIGTNFKQWKAVQTILTLAFVFLCFSTRFFLEKMFRTGAVEQTIQSMSEGTTKIGGVYLPVSWFASAVNDCSISSILLIIGSTIVLFEVVFRIFARSYKKINSAMKTTSVSHKFKLGGLKQNSIIQAIAIKELRRFKSSTTYMVNLGFGYIMALVIGVASLFIGLDRILAVVLQGAPITSELIMPSIPFVIYFLTGMVPITTCAPSLEGKNYWILKSSPITNKQIYLGKMLAGLYIAVPSQLITTLFFCISVKASIGTTVSFLILGIALCLFSTTLGCACGIHFMRLDWENEIEVIKQSTAVAIYLFPNMILTMVFLFVSILLAGIMGISLTTLIITVFYVLLSIVFYFRSLKLAESK